MKFSIPLMYCNIEYDKATQDFILMGVQETDSAPMALYNGSRGHTLGGETLDALLAAQKEAYTLDNLEATKRMLAREDTYFSELLAAGVESYTTVMRKRT